MYSSSDWRKATTKLLELTADGIVAWEPSSLFTTEDHRHVLSSYQTQLSDAIFVISEVQYQQYIDETEWYWQIDFDLSVFETTDSGYRKIATAPRVVTVESIFNAAENSYAYSKNILGDLLE